MRTRAPSRRWLRRSLNPVVLPRLLIWVPSPADRVATCCYPPISAATDGLPDARAACYGGPVQTRRSAAKQPLPLSIRFPRDLLARIDRYADRLRAEHPGLAISRGDAVRVLVSRALDAAEAQKTRP